MKLLVGIVTIDRDYEKLATLYACLQNQVPSVIFDYIVVTRKQDTKVQKECTKWKKTSNTYLHLVENYTIKKTHNLKNLIYKRTIIFQYANENKYDYVWCLDSDILPYENTFHLLFEKLIKLNCDVVSAPYKNRWGQHFRVGIQSPYPEIQKFQIKHTKDLVDEDVILYVGFGCLLVKNTCFHIKIENFFYQSTPTMFYEGEDFGFCNNLIKQNKKICSIQEPVRHFYNKPSCPIQ
jgi:hypothetical protein